MGEIFKLLLPQLVGIGVKAFKDGKENRKAKKAAKKQARELKFYRDMIALENAKKELKILEDANKNQ